MRAEEEVLFAFIAVLSWYKTLVVEVDNNYSFTSQLSQLQFQPYYPLMQDHSRLVVFVILVKKIR